MATSSFKGGGRPQVRYFSHNIHFGLHRHQKLMNYHPDQLTFLPDISGKSTMHFVNAVDCYNCSRSEDKCRDEVFLDYDQQSLECGVGSCMKVKYKETGEVDRYCDKTRRDPGCLTMSDFTVCACHYKDKCNGPVGDEAAKEGGLQCYDCYLNPECSDEAFSSHPQVLVNCGTGSCIKTKFKESGQVHRHCSTIRFPQGCSDQSYDGHPAESCACQDKDGCNQATKISQTPCSYSIIFVMLLWLWN